MATVTIRPNEKFQCAWGIDENCDYTLVNDSLTYPTDPTASSAILADGWILADNNQYCQFGFVDTPSNLDEVSRIDIYLYGLIDNAGTAGNYPEASYSINSGVDWSTDVNCTSFPSNNTTDNPALGEWHVITVTSLSWSKTVIDGFRIRVCADVPDGDKSTLSFNLIWAIQVLVTYTEAAGYSHDFMGVLAANIGSVMGVPTENIASINGV